MTQDDITLIEPTAALQEAYLDFLEEFRGADEAERITGAGWDFGGNFEGYVRLLQDRARGMSLPAGWVPSSAYWLVCGGRILAVCDLRHRLTDALRDFGGHVGYSVRPSERNKGYGTVLLKLALEKARRRGIRRVRVTCDRNNAASVRVIEKNGGVLDSESYSQQAGRVTRRYWIDLGESET